MINNHENKLNGELALPAIFSNNEGVGDKIAKDDFESGVIETKKKRYEVYIQNNSTAV